MSEEEKKNPLQGLVDFYKESVAEQDKLGFADIYKRETERFLKKLDEHFKEFYQLSFTPEDIEYGDGYFLFGHGTNSTIAFHVKEAPGWLFGIWWNPVEIIATRREGEPERYYDDRIKCQFFAQYEETIDKFKPSASTFEGSFEWFFEKPDEEENLWRMCFDARRVVQLILQYPYVAFVRELHWQDLNEEYITPEEAKKIYQEWRLRENAKNLMKQENERAMLDCICSIWEPWIMCGDAFIADSGENCSPRYELVIRNIWKDDQGQEESPDGLYGMFDFGVDWADQEEDKALWDETIKECEARADALDAWWFNPVSHCLYILSGEKYWDFKKRAEIKKEE